MMRARWWLVQCLSVLATVYSAATAANPLAELQASGHLRIDSALTPSEGIVPGQRVQLTIKIATDTWFTGGTRIGIPEVPGLVILQTEQFARVGWYKTGRWMFSPSAPETLLSARCHCRYR